MIFSDKNASIFTTGMFSTRANPIALSYISQVIIQHQWSRSLSYQRREVFSATGPMFRPASGKDYKISEQLLVSVSSL